MGVGAVFGMFFCCGSFGYFIRFCFMRTLHNVLFTFSLLLVFYHTAISQVLPGEIKFVRQGVRRLVFDEGSAIPLARLVPGEVVGMASMYPVTPQANHAAVEIVEDVVAVQSTKGQEANIWFGGFNPFATYVIDLDTCVGDGEVGVKFSDAAGTAACFVTVAFQHSLLRDVRLRVLHEAEVVVDKSIAVNGGVAQGLKGRLILQMLGSGLTLYLQEAGLPQVIGQADFNTYIDLRKKHYIQTFQSHLYAKLSKGSVRVRDVTMALTSGVGLADIRAITYENGEPLLDRGRLWYTMSIRGRALPHHIQGVFSMDPTVFDVKLEGIVVFDRQDGLLRNEIASHLFYDRRDRVWRGITTGFSAFANPQDEEKQLLAVESVRDPRFGFSIMQASPFGVVGDIEDPHILFDSVAHKWRILACENIDGYKAVMLESDTWNQGYARIFGPTTHNSTGTSIQRIGGQRYCFSGSSERQIFIYTYPNLQEAGTLKMDLPPWDDAAGTRVWSNVVQLPAGYPFRYVALMMDRYNYPGMSGPHWSYGAIYLYHGYE